MVMGDNSCSKGRGFKYRCCIMDGPLYCSFEKTENKRKSGRVGPFLKRAKWSKTCFQGT